MGSEELRLPQAVLKQCGIESQVELAIKDNCIILKPIKAPREGWVEAFKLMNKNKDDVLLIPEEIDADLMMEEWDEPKH